MILRNVVRLLLLAKAILSIFVLSSKGLHITSCCFKRQSGGEQRDPGVLIANELDPARELAARYLWRSPPGLSPIPGRYLAGVICINRSTLKFTHTPSNVFWITATMLDFPDRGVPFKMMICPGACSWITPSSYWVVRQTSTKGRCQSTTRFHRHPQRTLQ